ncbi:Branched-chain-amino-acid aminotransferase, mitochondrial, partial [Apostichopus japonicus]
IPTVLKSFKVPQLALPLVRCFNSHDGHDGSFKFSDLNIQLTRHHRPKPDYGKLMFGKNFSDHMFEVQWSKENGWEEPRIAPLHNLSLHPAATSLQYAIELKRAPAVRSSPSGGHPLPPDWLDAPPLSYRSASRQNMKECPSIFRYANVELFATGRGPQNDKFVQASSVIQDETDETAGPSSSTSNTSMVESPVGIKKYTKQIYTKTGELIRNHPEA